MVGYPPNGMEADQCFVTVHWWVKMDLFVLVWRPLLQGRIWKSSLSLPVITNDDDMIGSITTRFVSLPLCYLGFSLVSTKTKTLSSTTVSISCAYRCHHHNLYSRRPPLSLSAFGSTFPSFVFGCIWVAMVNGFNLEREKLDNLAWVWNLGILGGFVDLKKWKNSKSTDWEMLMKERKMKELKRVFL